MIVVLDALEKDHTLCETPADVWMSDDARICKPANIKSLQPGLVQYRKDVVSTTGGMRWTSELV